MYFNGNILFGVVPNWQLKEVNNDIKMNDFKLMAALRTKHVDLKLVTK